MRQVDSEGGFQSSRGRKRSGARSSPAQKSNLRRLALESLEVRTLLSTTPKIVNSTLPSPVADAQIPLGGNSGFVPALTSSVANQSTPSVAVDPLNPQKLVAVWQTYDPANLLDGSGGKVTTYVQGAFSIDGGTTWTELSDDTDADIQTDFSVAPTSPQPNFSATTDATVAFDRNENVYLLTSTHNTGSVSGVLDLQRWNFSTAKPVAATFSNGSTLNPVYTWQGVDGALSPTLAVDTNLPSFPVVPNPGDETQTDAFAGNVYVAWETVTTAPKNVTINPNVVALVSSSNLGQSFTHPVFTASPLNTGFQFDSPKIAISQGTPVPFGSNQTPTVVGGQATIVYDDSAPGNGSSPAPHSDFIISQASDTGGTSEQISTSGPIQNPPEIGTTGDYVPTTTNFNFAVDFTGDTNFTTLSNLSLNLSLQYTNLNDTSAVLVSPTGGRVTLWLNAVNGNNQTVNTNGVLAGNNIGSTALGTFIGTTLDSTALRSLFDGSAAAPYDGNYRPLGNLTAPFRGQNSSQLKGTWQLQITTFQPQTSPPPIQVVNATLNFTSGNSDLQTNGPTLVSQTFLNSGSNQFTDGIQSVAVLPNPTIASDNTLGTMSPFQGRLYVAVTNDNFIVATGAYTTSTFIELYFSDDGGTTWNLDGVVNDDNGLTDGFSTGGYALPGQDVASQFDPNVDFFGQLSADVRPKIEPQVAVDQYTGTLVVSFLDTRNDAAAVRTATYIAASTDGGSSFAPEVYANPTTDSEQLPTQDAVTGATVALGPIPDNQSSGNFAREATYGFGQHQGLAVADGMIIPVWASNMNLGSAQVNSKVFLGIESAQLGIAAGPRVISSTQGPVGLPGDTVNGTKQTDGTPIANTIVLTFDRAVDPASFLADNGVLGSSPIQVFYNNPGGAAVAAPVQLPVLSVTPDSTDTIYTIVFDPTNPTTGLPFGVGDYSYTLKPLVSGMIPFQSLITVIQQVPFIDTAKTTTSAFSVTGNNGVALTKASITGSIDIYQPGQGAGAVNIFLETQDGNHQYLLSTTNTGNMAANTVIPINSTIAIPAADGEMLDQNYTILVTDSVANQAVFIFNDVNPNDFSFQVQLDEGLTQTISGNSLDQNGNGIPGEQPGDDYAIPDGRNTLPLIVPGPHVVSTSVIGVNGTVGSGTNNLVNNDSVNSINVTFDRTINVNTFNSSTTANGSSAQVLSIVGPAGPINTPQTFTSTGTSTTYSSSGVPLAIPKATGGTNGVLTSTIPISGAISNVSNLTVQVNITDPNDSSLQLSLQAPDGTIIPLVAAGTAAGANFTNTTFSDTPPANGLTLTIPGAPASAAAPYGLTYQPASPLAGLAGKAINGNWSLIISTTSTTLLPSSLVATGLLNSWSLNITQSVGTLLSSPLVVASYPDNSFKIAHLAVQLNISATKDSDLQVSLIAPDGTTIIPLIPTGLSGSNFTGTTFDDNATIPIASGVAPYNQTYRPVGSLATLIGKSIEGTWKLKITDANGNSSTATLNSWSLIATPQITVSAVSPSLLLDGTPVATTFNVKFPTQKLSGTYTVTLSPTISSYLNPTALTSTAQSFQLDSNLNAGVYNLEGISTGATTSEQFVATSVPVAIPYATKPAIGPIIDGTLNSQINVTDNFAVQGDLNADTLAGLTVSLNIIYYYDPDLSVTLTAPNSADGTHIGNSVTLFANIGKGANTANFTNTTLSDAVTPPAPIIKAGAPFFGTFNPQFPLSDFATYTDGTQAFSGGLWTLTITNRGLDPGSTIDAQYPPSLLGWSMNFQKPQANTGLGEPVADRATVGFQLFNLAPTNPLANDTWTAVGPAGTTTLANPNDVVGSSTGVNLGGPVSVIAIDPADPSGNTAYVGASSGGIWKTNDFLTTNASGPTYVPLTDFGANYAINIGSIAIFDQNNDPNQSIIIAGTGNGQATNANSGNSIQGVGFLRSTNGGTSFTLLDSSENVYPAIYPTTYPNGTAVPANLVGTAVPSNLVGTALPINSPFRDHIFVGSTTYKVIVDSTQLPGGGVIIYAALGGKNGGLWRSQDGGNTWQNLSAGVVPQVNGQNAAATDVLLDQNSRSGSTGNLDILYAGFQGVGVFMSANRGLGLTEMTGGVGFDNLIQNSQFAPGAPLTVPANASPNGANGRILLAKPALTNSAAENILYQSWLYVAVENANGTFNGLYVTKDTGQNWTKAQIASVPTTTTDTVALPTNDNTQTNNYDVTNGKTFPIQNGNANFSMTIDPLNAAIVYLGGTTNYQTSGLIRVDLTGMFDAHNFVPFANNLNDGGKLAFDSAGAVNVNIPGDGVPFFQGINPSGSGTGFNYLNLVHSPIAVNAFDINSTQYVFNSSAFNNDGYGVTWTPLDTPYADPLDGSTNIHQLTTIIDPLTGLTRLLIADDQGVFTTVLNADGTLDEAGIGTDVAITGSRNGNLQDEALYDTAAQPSALAAATAGALFYGSGVGLADLQSSPTLLSTGDLVWNVVGVSYGDLQNVVDSNNRAGTGIATDQTGGSTINNPIGTGPSVYEFDVPYLGGDSTNFFRVNNNGQTTGLTNNFQAGFPGNGVLSNPNGVTQLGTFEVNPINGSQILIGSNLGNVYETTNKGIQWLQIGSAANFDGTYPATLAYGAPDPNSPGGLGNLNNFIYVGTEGGNIYLTQTGGAPWTNLSSGLDGSAIVSIYTNPNRASHEVYAVTLKGVYYMADSVASASNPNPTWVNITGNLNQIQSNPLGDPTMAQSALLGYNGATGQDGGFRSIVVDYRYAIPDPSGNGLVHPVLYVAGYGGVFRSLDNGQTWSIFPNINFDSAPVDGGYLPSVDVTSLQLNLGAINPATGHAVQVANDPEVLLASTLGRGDFAIRLAPDVFSSTISLDTTLPAPGGSASGAIRGYPNYTNVQTPYIDGDSEISNYGNQVTVTLFDQTTGIAIGNGFTDAFGKFSFQVGTFVKPPTGLNPNLTPLQVIQQLDPTFLNDGLKTIGIQATDSSLAQGNVTLFTYTLKATPPANPTNLALANDSGRSPADDKSRLIPPVLTVSTTEPNSTLVELVRLTYSSVTKSFVAPYEVVGTASANAGTVTLTDTLLGTELAGQTIQQNVTYYVTQVDLADNFSTPLASITSDPTKLTIFLNNVTPAAPNAPTLDPTTDSGTKGDNVTNNLNPLFDVTGLLTTPSPIGPFNLELFRSFGGSTPVQVGTALPGATQIQDTSGIPIVGGAYQNGVYVYSVVQVDLEGNISALSQGLPVTINTQQPVVPTLVLDASSDSGLPSHPNITKFNSNLLFDGTGTPNLTVILYNQASGQGIGSATIASNGTYQIKVTGPVADGTYTLVAKTTNVAGNTSTSLPLTITIKAIAPNAPKNLQLSTSTDTGIVGDGVTANHHPLFVGTADVGTTVTLYSVVNGVLSAPQATTTASTTNGSFSIQLPFNLTDGVTQLVVRSTDIAGNSGPLSAPLLLRIVSVPGDYYATGIPRFTVFNPQNESYTVQNAGTVQVDTTPGRDVPVQYDYNGDGTTDLVAYRYNSAEYFGTLMGTGAQYDKYFGQPGAALPVPGYYGGYGTYIDANYLPATATWTLNLPQPGGFVINFGVPKIDIPVPAAYDGNGLTEIATFRPVAVNGNDADSFNVVTQSTSYQVSFTSPAVQNLGFVYKAGDQPAPADYDGVGRDEFAVYRPSTGQFFILNTHGTLNSAAWTMRTVTLNLPGGPNAKDVPASQDYTGDGKADPTVYRPSNSTFYMINSATGVQQNTQFGTPGVSIAAAGPLLYRLTALQGSYASSGGYGTGTGVTTGAIALTSGSALHTESVASAGTTSSTSTSAASAVNLSNMIVVSTPMPVTSAVVPSTPVSTVTTTPVTTTPVTSGAVTVGAVTPRTAVSTTTQAKVKSVHAAHPVKLATDKTKIHAVKPVTIETKTHAVKVDTTIEHPKAKTTAAAKTTATASHKTYAAAAVAALQKLVLAKKGQKQG